MSDNDYQPPRAKPYALKKFTVFRFEALSTTIHFDERKSK